MSINPPRVLCVDHNQDSRDAVGLLLSFSGITVDGVANAQQALSLVQTERFDLYLLDSWLPDVDGFELCRRLRAYDPQVPILFFSGAAYDADRNRGIAAGADAYVVKPDIEGMIDSVKEFVYTSA